MSSRVEFQVPKDYGRIVLASYACHDDKSRGRLHSQSHDNRPEFERDHSRLTHLDAWRRMEGKTQVFIHLDRGDHYRNRANHTNEVVQIARSVARRLGFNPDLTQTVAQAHDLGHPPFGHGGEEVLDRLMEPYGGFDHNAQAIRLLTRLQGKYVAHEGIDLTWEALEGIAKHNGPVKNPPRALREYNEIHDLELHTRASGEAQIAAICDDIAYNNHDIEDGLRSGILSVRMLLDLPLVGDVYKELMLQHPDIRDDQLIFEAKRRIITIMTDDVILQTRKNIEKSGVQSPDDIRNLDYQLVSFTSGMQKNLDAIRKFLMQNMYRHEAVTKHLEQAKSVLAELFIAFIEDPSLLPDDWQQRADGARTQKTAEAVCDYLAGMTDKYVYTEHSRVFGKREKKKKMKKILAVFVLIASLFSHAATAACNCLTVETNEEEINRAEAIFVATVHKTMTDGVWVNNFEIHDAWKGFALKSNVAWQQIIVPRDSCNYIFENGRTYLVFVDAVTAKGEIGVTNCSFTAPVGESTESLMSLGEPLKQYKKEPTVRIGGQM